MAANPCPHCVWWATKTPDRRETFRLLTWEWDIDRAKAVVADGRVPGVISLDSLRGLVDWPPDDGFGANAGRINPFTVYVLAEHVPHVDPAVPLILGWLPRQTGQAVRRRVVIDGHHRIARAIDLNLESLPAYLLTPEESDSIFSK